VLVDGGLTLRRDHPGLEASWGAPLFPFLMVAVFVPWLLLTAFLLKSYRSRVSTRWRKLAFWVPLVLILAFVIAMSVAIVSNVARPWALRAVVTIALEAVAANPIGQVMAWGAALGLLIWAYHFVRERFLRIEMTADSVCVTLWDMMERART